MSSPIPDPSGKGPPSSYAPLPSGMPPPSYVPGSGTLVLPSATNGPHDVIVTQLPRASGTPGLPPSATAERTFSSKGSSTASASGYPSPLPSYSPPGSSSLVTYSGSPSVGSSVTFPPSGSTTVSPDPFSSSASLGPLFPESSHYPSLLPTASPSAELAAGAGLSPAEIAAVSGGGILICVFVLLLIIYRCLKQGSLPTGRQMGNIVADAAARVVTVEMPRMITNPMGPSGISASSAVTIVPRPTNSRNNSGKKGNNTRKGGGKQKTRKQRGGTIQADLFALAHQFTEMIMVNGGIMNIPELIRQMVPKVAALINSTSPRERLKNL